MERKRNMQEEEAVEKEGEDAVEEEKLKTQGLG